MTANTYSPSDDQPTNQPGAEALYEIQIKGHLDPSWSDWLGELTITPQADDVTLLTGPIVDQAALHGLLKRVRDLGMPLVSVNPVEPGAPTALGTGSEDA